ncbi:MAG: ATP-binding protein [Anaeromyxobacter sp.]
MQRGSWIAVAITALVLLGVGWFAYQTARRDRAALVKSFADEHLVRVRIAVREIEAELGDVRKHLELASRLVDATDSGNDQRRELEALVSVVRTYRMVVVYDAQGRERVVVIDPAVARWWSRRPYAESVRATAMAALARQGMAISPPLGNEASPWHRAFAMPLVREGEARGAVVILADQQATFERLRLVAPGGGGKLILIGPHGSPAPITDPALAAMAGAPEADRGPLADLLSAMRAGHTGTLDLSRDTAAAVGLEPADAVAVFVPVRTADGAGHWSVGVLESTAALESQERAIVMRMALLAGVFASALIGLSVYLVLAARRSIAVQERLRAAEQVARLREKAEKILENVPVAVMALDEEGRVSGLNVEARQRFPRSEVGGELGQAFPEAAPSAVAALRGLVSEARATGAVQHLQAQPLSLSRARSFGIHAVPLPHPLPDMSLLVVLEDVTDLRELSSQLLRAEKLATVGVIASGIAHEVGTPLGVVRGRAEMLDQALAPEQAEAKGSTRVILEEIDRIARTIQQLLDFARVSQADVTAVELGAAAVTVAELLAFEARKRKVAVVLELPPNLPPLAANPDQLNQVLVNLVLNAIHACAEGGHVWIRARSAVRGRLAAIEVADDGAGVPEELRHRVFDPFFTTKKRGKGTGLGLTVAAQIVRNHGGEIDLESEEGLGTTVVLSWPLLAASGQEQAHETQGRTHTGRR